VAWYSWQRIYASPLWSDLYQVTYLNAYYCVRYCFDRAFEGLFVTMAAFLTVLMFLPDPMQTALIEALVTIFANLSLLAFFYSQAKVSALLCVVLVALACFLGGWAWTRVYVYDKVSAKREKKKRLRFNEAVRARKAYNKFLETGEFNDENNRKRGYFFKERDPLATASAYSGSLASGLDEDSFDDGGENEESKQSPKAKPRDAATRMGSFPFSSPFAPSLFDP
jgi:hypothetical protein